MTAFPEVVIVGCGPVGLAAAALLGSAGVPTLVLERNPSTSDEAKAISLDDESLRTLQRAGVVDDVYPVLQPGTGTLYLGADGRPLVHARGRRPYRFGHPFKSAFAQPDLELALLKAVERLPSVRVEFSTTVLDLHQGRSGVDVGFTRGDGAGAGSVGARYVLGCDGGRSTVRQRLGIKMTGRSFDDPWLVVDTRNDPHRQRYGMHHGDPSRPCVVIPGSAGRCRYEFKLAAGEWPAGAAGPEGLALRLIGAHRAITADDIERCTVYRFHGLVATRWQQGRVFLLGDAAHMMPPFAGQGLNSGVRDGDNLCWKLVAVLAGRAAPSLLETYESERRPHAEAMVRLSTRLGHVVMTSRRPVAAARDFTVRAANRLPQGRRYLAEMRFKPAASYRRGFVVAGGPPAPAHAMVGRLLEQPRCLLASGRLCLLDEALGPGMALVGAGCSAGDWEELGRAGADFLGARLVDAALDDTMAVDTMTVDGAPGGGANRIGIADADGHLQRLLAPVRGAFVLVRPDRFVAAVFRPSEAAAVAAALRPFVAGGEPATSP